jgi:predicted lipoprotein with Yx(FWY)xxD motif
VALGVLGALVAVPAPAGATTTPRTARVVSVAQDPKFGPILVAGRTVYTVTPSRKACSTTCQKVWHPVLLPHGVKHATAGMGVDAAKLGTVAAAHHARQITYAGKRLYWFAKDTAPGQAHTMTTTKWGTWSTVAVAGSAPTTAPPATDAPTTAPPATAAPTTEAPETQPPATEAPATEPPATQAPATSPPETRPPATTTPGTGGVAF